MYCGLQSIERACGRIFVGLTTVQMILPADVVTYPLRGRSGLYETDIVLKSGAVLHNIEFDPGTAGWSQEIQSSTSGDVYRNSVTFRIRRDRPEQAAFLGYLKNKRIHLLITDEDGQKHLVLSARASARAENGPRGGRNHYNYSFQSADRQPAGFLSAEVINQDGNVLVAAVLQSPDGNYWKLAIGICAEVVTLSTTDTNVIPSEFRIEDNEGITFELSIDNCGSLNTTASAGTPGQILLDAPDGNTYELSIGTCETLITTQTGSDLPNPDDSIIGG